MTDTDKETTVTYPQAFEKDGVTDVAHTPAQAVALKFRGYKPQNDEPTVAEKEPSYAELQAQARSLNESEDHDIKLNLPYDDLLEAVTEAAQFEAELADAEVTS